MTTEERYQAAVAKFMENDQPTIEQHLDFADAMWKCAEDCTEDRETYIKIAEAQERVIIIKRKYEAGK